MSARRIAATALAILAGAFASMSTDAQTTSTDPVLAAMQQHQAQLDAQLKLIQTEQSIATATLPTSTAAPKAGSFTETGSNPFPVTRMAYQDLAKVAATVAADVEAKANSGAVKHTVFIYDATEVSALMNVVNAKEALNVLAAQLQGLKAEVDKEAQRPFVTDGSPTPKAAAAAHPKGFALTPLVAMSALKATSDLIGMFRTDTTIAYSNLSNDDVSLIAAVVHELVAKQVAVYQSAAMPLQLSIDQSDLVDGARACGIQVMDIQKQLADLQAQWQLASDALGAASNAIAAAQTNKDTTKQAALDLTADAARRYALQILGLDAKTALDADTASAMKGERDQRIKDLLPLTSVGTTLASAMSSVQTALVGFSATTGAPNGAALLRAERVLRLARATPGGLFLAVKCTALGGSVVTRVNLFTGGHLLYTGGAIASYTLFDLDGHVLAAGLVPGDGMAERAQY